jgi:hypothetical protein
VCGRSVADFVKGRLERGPQPPILGAMNWDGFGVLCGKWVAIVNVICSVLVGFAIANNFLRCIN